MRETMQRFNYFGARLIVIIFGMCVFIAQPSAQGEAEWVSLIDGMTGLANFNKVGTAEWIAADDAISADAGGEGVSFLVSKDAYGDFQLQVEFWASDDANSGIFLRCAGPGKIDPTSCYEVNIYDQRPDPTYGTGAIVDVAKVEPMPKAGGRWNIFEISALGSRLVVVLNGQKTVDIENDRLASGLIALQWGSGLIKFRKVQIKPL